MYLEKLRKIRESKMLSQKQLAEMIGLDQSAYSKIENGINQLSVFTLLSIVDALKISVTDILNQKSLILNQPLTYNKKNFNEKLEIYNNAIKELELIVEDKLKNIEELKKNRDELIKNGET